MDVGSIPELGEKGEGPKPGRIRISQCAIDSRMRRVMAPNVNGEFKVSTEIIKQWQTRKGRKSLEQLFQSCGYSPERGLKKVFVYKHVDQFGFFEIMMFGIQNWFRNVYRYIF